MARTFHRRPAPSRAGAPLTFPTKTTKASAIFPDLDQYRGKPLDFGRMERTVSDPNVKAQAGMRVGIPNAGQLNALATLNIRGERSVTCKGAFDAHPSTGPLPPGAPAECEAFRKQPDALERAAELDAQYGRNPDLAALPMYCVVAAFKDPFDTKDMRTTANSDVAFAMDVPPVRFDDRGAAARQGRDHLREIECARVQRADRAIRVERRRAARTRWRAAKPSARGRARRAIRTTPNACRADRAAAQESRSQRTW